MGFQVAKKKRQRRQFSPEYKADLHPSKPLALRPGERVAVVVIRRPDPSRWDLDRLARHGEEDEALASGGLDDCWSDAIRPQDAGMDVIAR